MEASETEQDPALCSVSTSGSPGKSRAGEELTASRAPSCMASHYLPTHLVEGFFSLRLDFYSEQKLSLEETTAYVLFSNINVSVSIFLTKWKMVLF